MLLSRNVASSATTGSTSPNKPGCRRSATLPPLRFTSMSMFAACASSPAMDRSGLVSSVRASAPIARSSPSPTFASSGVGFWTKLRRIPASPLNTIPNNAARTWSTAWDVIPPLASTRAARSFSGSLARMRLTNSWLEGFARACRKLSTLLVSSTDRVDRSIFPARLPAVSAAFIARVGRALASVANATGSTSDSKRRTRTGRFMPSSRAGSIPKRAASARNRAAYSPYLASSAKLIAIVRPLPDRTLLVRSTIGAPRSMALVSASSSSGDNCWAIPCTCNMLVCCVRSRGCNAAGYSGLTSPVAMLDALSRSRSTTSYSKSYLLFGSIHAWVTLPVPCAGRVRGASSATCSAACSAACATGAAFGPLPISSARRP